MRTNTIEEKTFRNDQRWRYWFHFEKQKQLKSYLDPSFGSYQTFFFSCLPGLQHRLLLKRPQSTCELFTPFFTFRMVACTKEHGLFPPLFYSQFS